MAGKTITLRKSNGQFAGSKGGGPGSRGGNKARPPARKVVRAKQMKMNQSQLMATGQYRKSRMRNKKADVYLRKGKAASLRRGSKALGASLLGMGGPPIAHNSNIKRGDVAVFPKGGKRAKGMIIKGRQTGQLRFS